MHLLETRVDLGECMATEGIPSGNVVTIAITLPD